MSSGAASSNTAAARVSFVRTSRQASAIELPAVTALRLAKVPTPKGTAAVSPPMTVIQSIGTPRASAAIWAKLVSCPWPELIAPVATSTRPARSSFTVAPSKGPMAVPSTYPEMPMPRWIPCARRRG